MARSSSFFWWDAWAEGVKTAVQVAETMAAVPVVVGRRMPLIEAAARNPLTADYPELYRMVAEKTEAFTLAGVSLARDLQAIQADMLRPPRSGVAAAEASARIGRRAAEATGRALAPVHKRATANAKRLRRG